MAPLHPGMLPLAKAIGFAAVALKLDPEKAFNLVLDALCDGALYATAIFPSANGPPNSLTISPANWQMHKYNGAQLHYDFVEIVTVDLIEWLRLDEVSAEPSAGDAPVRSGGPGRPSSMHLVIEEAKRRTAESMVDAPTKKAFADELETWISAQSGQPPLTSKTIAQNPEFTSLYNDLKRARNSSPK